MLIWDTGEYSVLPYRESVQSSESSDCESDSSNTASPGAVPSECQKLHVAFKQRKVRLRLHGTRLPQNYTISLRLSKEEDRIDQPRRPVRRRRKLGPRTTRTETPETSTSEDENDRFSSSDVPSRVLKKDQLQPFRRIASPPLKDEATKSASASHLEDPQFKTKSSGKPQALPQSHKSPTNSSPTIKDPNPIHITSETETENETIRLTNAYPGSTNTISSIHQRRWFLYLDRHNSGFVPQRDEATNQKTWVRKRNAHGTKDGFERFHVLGREVERSIVTGRLAVDVLRDEGVQGFVPRGLWRAVVE
jgi:hypothetical protein